MKPSGTTEPTELHDVLPNNHAGIVVSWVVVVIVTVVLLAQVIELLGRARGHRKAQQRAESSHDPHARLVPGDAVLYGRVEYAEGSDHAVRVEVEQHGTESESSGSWSHNWTEVDRRVRVTPFYLRGESGQRVRVEPASDVELVDELDGKVLVDRTTRVRTATLMPGEAVYVRGSLVAAPDPETPTGYRGGTALVLRAPARQPMLISSEPLGARFARRVTFHRRWALLFLGALGVAHLTMVYFHGLVVRGRTSVGVVEGTRHFVTTDSDDDDVHHYEVTVRVPGSDELLVDEVDSSDFAQIDQGERMVVRSVRGIPAWRQLGSEASMHAAQIVLLLVVVALLSALYRVLRKATRPWYLRKVVDSGSGRLPDVSATSP